MQTKISAQYSETKLGQEADSILRSCVHCGFCTATCPSYQVLGDELDSPRGRIYLIKQILEGETVTHKTQLHLDRCLTCRSCETTCPSGVNYSRLIDIGRTICRQHVSPPFRRQVVESLLRFGLTNPKRFKFLHKMGGYFNRVLPKFLKMEKDVTELGEYPDQGQFERYVIMPEGCVQPTMKPSVNHATVRVLNKLGVGVKFIPEFKCCGAISHHLNAHDEAIKTIKNNIDTWWPHVSNGCEAIISNASGCGIMIKDYAELLKDDQQYADKAVVISESCQDISEFVVNNNPQPLKLANSKRVVFHPPCTLQHGLQLNELLTQLLIDLGFELVENPESHLCCGSAGTYSILHPKISEQLKQRKLNNLMTNKPDFIVTANIGCQYHLQFDSEIPVLHWVELLDL